MKEVLLLFAALSAGPTPLPTLAVPPGTIMTVNATICLSKEHMVTLVNTELAGGDLQKTFNSLGDCDSYCVTVGVVGEMLRFKMRDERLFAVYEVIGLNGNPQSFWIATAIEGSGWPLKPQAGAAGYTCHTPE